MPSSLCDCSMYQTVMSNSSVAWYWALVPGKPVHCIMLSNRQTGLRVRDAKGNWNSLCRGGGTRGTDSCQTYLLCIVSFDDDDDRRSDAFLALWLIMTVHTLPQAAQTFENFCSVDAELPVSTYPPLLRRPSLSSLHSSITIPRSLCHG